MPVIPEVGDAGVVIAPVPEILVHNPVPFTGVFPARFPTPPQALKAEPALDTSGGATILRLPLLLDVPITAGLEPITRIRYPAPVGVPPGIVAMTVPEVVPASDPIFVGAAKEPAASDNCAVNVFPATKAHTPTVKGTLTLTPAQKGEPATTFVVMKAFIVRFPLLLDVP